MIFNAIKIFMTNNSFTVTIPFDKYIEWKGLSEMLQLKHNCYAYIKISKPFKPRSTGYKSSNHHLHGHIRQIADELGNYVSEIKNYIKQECPGWPIKTVLGKAVPKSEAELSSAEEAAAIEFCHLIADENNIRLIENEEDK